MKLIALSALFITSAFCASTQKANPALHKLASVLENEDSSLGAFARLYNQFDQINDGENHHQDDEMIDDTRIIDGKPKLEQKARPDYDPSY
jgi:hypothetical protein